jgi:hypothetical protein
MPEEVKLVDYYSAAIPDKPGEGARVLAAFKEAGVNLLAFSGFPAGRRAQIDLIPENDKLFRSTAKKLNFAVSAKKKAFLIGGSERCGVAADILGALGKAGINVTSLQVLCAGAGRYGAILWVKPEDVRRAKKVLEKL